jgi:hypothetical protein
MFAELRFATDRNYAVAMMVVEKIREHHSADAEVGMVAVYCALRRG